MSEPATDAGPEPTAEPGPPPAEARQRWRFLVARSADAPGQSQREAAEAWEIALAAAGLPVARTTDARARPRISFGAPLPVGMAAEAELIDVVLTERWPAWRTREALTPHLPPGWRLVDLHDVWLAGPPLAGRVVAADYRVLLDGDASDQPLEEACAALLAADRIERYRRKGDTLVAYDLRPLLVDLAVAEAGPPPRLMVRTRIHPELGTGRPEEVVGALADALGAPIEATSIIRERVLLVDDVD
jgi:radical SAM-linked protein